MANSQSPLLTWEKDGKWGVGVTEATLSGYPYETRKDALSAIEQFDKLGGQTPGDHMKQFNDFSAKVDSENKAAEPNTLEQAPLGDDAEKSVTANNLAARVRAAQTQGSAAIEALYADPEFKAELKAHGLQVNGAAVKAMIDEAKATEASGQVGATEAATTGTTAGATTTITGALPATEAAAGAAAPGVAGVPIQRTGQASTIAMDGPKAGSGAGQSGDHSPNA